MVPEERYPVRVRFSKVGSLKFISHLDLSRTMKAAFLRAKLPIWYTLGFNHIRKWYFLFRFRSARRVFANLWTLC